MVEITRGDRSEDKAKGVMGCRENVAYFFFVDITPFDTCSSL